MVYNWVWYGVPCENIRYVGIFMNVWFCVAGNRGMSLELFSTIVIAIHLKVFLKVIFKKLP